MSNRAVTKAAIPLWAIIAVLAVIVVLVGWFGWKALRGHAEGDRVPVDINKMRESLQENGFGRRGR